MKIDLKIHPIDILDIRDDFLMNYDYELYDFIDDIPEIAFYIGLYIKKWFPLLEPSQRYLHSKSLRHVQLEISKYKDQIKFWTEQYPSNDSEVDIIDISNYILNNVMLDEEMDIIPLSLYLGLIMSANKVPEEELLFNVR
jgi:hypothetical protein